VSGELLRGSLLERTVRHTKGCPKCARGEGHQVCVLTVTYPGGRTRQFACDPFNNLLNVRVASSNKFSRNNTLAIRKPRSASVKKASILRCALIKLLSGVDDMPAETCRIVELVLELVRATRD
jgi:hypothetical protein